MSGPRHASPSSTLAQALGCLVFVTLAGFADFAPAQGLEAASLNCEQLQAEIKALEQASLVHRDAALAALQKSQHYRQVMGRHAVLPGLREASVAGELLSMLPGSAGAIGARVSGLMVQSVVGTQAAAANEAAAQIMQASGQGMQAQEAQQEVMARHERLTGMARSQNCESASAR